MIAAAALCSVAAVALPGQAEAQSMRRWDRASEYHYPVTRSAPVMRKKVRANTEKVAINRSQERKPQGPVTIVISIARQHLTLYDANGVFAESPVSTGMAGHATPMGVFSIIQKNRFHRSNLYSNAPMPFMQRITWSGVALHQGVLPGYPASHGCIRMPMAFASQLWGWTRMGARVVIVPDEGVAPREFSSPQLFARIVIPETEASQVASDGAVDVELQPIPAPEKSTARIAADRIQTADASNSAPVAKSDIKSDIMSEAAPMSDAEVERRIDAMVAGRPVESIKPVIAKSETAAPTVELADLKKAIDVPSIQSVKATVAAASTDSGSASDVIARTQLPGRPMISIAPAVKSAIAEAGRKRSGQVAVFVSRKENRLYVRQGFEPLFDVPVTIEGDKPLGTHVFTARTNADDPQALSWTVMTMPQLAPRRVEARNAPKSKSMTDAASPPAQASDASEALSRISFPKDAMDRIAAIIGTGGSLIVSDKGLGDETGRGTDFIVSLR